MATLATAFPQEPIPDLQPAMKVKVIAFELGQEELREALVAKIDGSWAWARLAPSTYAVLTQMSEQQLFDELEQFLDEDGTLFVFHLAPSLVGFGLADVMDFLDDNVTP